MPPVTIVKAFGDTPAEYQKRQERKIAELRRIIPTVSVHQNDTEVVARVNESRWLFDCPECRAGVLAHPEWQIGRCFGCGSVYTHIVFPPFWQAIEALLLVRGPVDVRHWLPGQTLGDLMQENRDMHITSPEVP